MQRMPRNETAIDGNERPLCLHTRPFHPTRYKCLSFTGRFRAFSIDLNNLVILDGFSRIATFHVADYFATNRDGRGPTPFIATLQSSESFDEDRREKGVDILQ
jgi:hypothetical protein